MHTHPLAQTIYKQPSQIFQVTRLLTKEHGLSFCEPLHWLPWIHKEKP
jgi:hypothetical protein